MEPISDIYHGRQQDSEAGGISDALEGEGRRLEGIHRASDMISFVGFLFLFLFERLFGYLREREQGEG